MRDFIVRYKTIIGILCGCLAYYMLARYHMHTQYQKQCPGTQYTFINDVLMCQHEGRDIKPKEYKERTR